MQVVEYHLRNHFYTPYPYSYPDVTGKYIRDDHGIYGTYQSHETAFKTDTLRLFDAGFNFCVLSKSSIIIMVIGYKYTINLSI